MNSTKRNGLIALLAAVSLAGCDPWAGQNKASASIQRVDAIDATFSASVNPVEVTTPNPDGSWTLNVGSLSQFNGNGDTAPFIVALVIQSNQLLNGDDIQTAPGDCTPKAGVFTITPAPDAGYAWYTCYNPTSATNGEGASIVLFESNDPSDPIGSATLPVGTTRIVGDVPSRGGGNLHVDVTAVTSA